MQGKDLFITNNVFGTKKQQLNNVRKGSVSSTQKSCYIVYRHQFLLLKGLIFIKKRKKRDIQSQISLKKFAFRVI